MTSSKKLIRHRSLKKLLRDNPFSTDEQLAKMLDVSVQTIRLDRVALGIPELRARTRTMAEEAQTKLRAIDKKDIVGELLDLELNKIGISTLKITSVTFVFVYVYDFSHHFCFLLDFCKPSIIQ